MARKRDKKKSSPSGNGKEQLPEGEQCKGQGSNEYQFHYAGYDVHHPGKCY